MAEKRKQSDLAEGLFMGIRQRAVWFHLLLEAAEKQNCDIEKLTDDAIFTYGQGVSKDADGTEPKDLLHHMCGKNVFFELFEKEIVTESEDYCEARFHRCPLVDAWREYGLESTRIDRLCQLANKGDFGRASHFSEARMTFPTRIGAGDCYCTLRIEREKRKKDE